MLCASLCYVIELLRLVLCLVITETSLSARRTISLMLSGHTKVLRLKPGTVHTGDKVECRMTFDKNQYNVAGSVDFVAGPFDIGY